MDNNEINIKVTEVDDILDMGIPVPSAKKFENHESPEKDVDIDKKESRLNPDTDVITKKDPGETIILPNDELKKWNNRNRNQPL